MLDHDKARARALAKVFSAQELEYITDWIMAAEHTTDPHRNRVEDIIWKAHDMAMESYHSGQPL